MKNVGNINGGVLLAVFCASTITYGGEHLQDTWIENVKGSPVTLISEEYTLTLRNRTRQLVNSYQLACARHEHDRFAVLHEFPIEQS